MKKNKGFTLVELLAVIVILAVILVIAIPNVMKIIDKARLDTYKRTEGMLTSATRSYLASNNISFTDNVPVSIDYITLRDNNYIDKIYDQTDSNVATKECVNSKVYITKIGNNYSYKPGLVCTNYVSLETFDLLGGSGDFEKDLDANGMGDGGWWSACTVASYNLSSTQKYFGNYSQYIYATTSSVGANPCLSKSFAAGIIDATHKYYLKTSYYKNNSNGYLGLNIYNTTDSQSNANYDLVRPVNNWYNFSTIVDMSLKATNSNSDNYQFLLYTNAGSSGTTDAQTYLDNTVILDLTNMGLSSKTAAEIEAIVNKSK
jgi:prepilin-type N-terminal cleavage/methylation domain-containing protein